jgi:hypothetical protein
MNSALDAFCTRSRASLKSRPLAQALPLIAEELRKLVSDADFVAKTFSDDMPPSKRVLYHDPETDMHVLAHVQEGNKTGKPHSHGTSWAIYGNARESTEMTEWRRVNPQSEEHAVLETAAKYRLGPGEARAYGPGVIHSTAHPKKAWVIRVTGTDLDVLPRYHFGRNDRILEKA